MKRAFLILAAVLCAASTGAAPGGCTNDGFLNPFAFETITVSSTSIGFTATTFAPAGQTQAVMAVATLATNDIRYRSDGLDPTAAIGHALAATGTITVCGIGSLRQTRFIRQTADGTLSVSYYRQVN